MITHSHFCESRIELNGLNIHKPCSIYISHQSGGEMNNILKLYIEREKERERERERGGGRKMETTGE